METVSMNYDLAVEKKVEVDTPNVYDYSSMRCPVSKSRNLIDELGYTLGPVEQIKEPSVFYRIMEKHM